MKNQECNQVKSIMIFGLYHQTRILSRLIILALKDISHPLSVQKEQDIIINVVMLAGVLPDRDSIYN